MLDHDTIERLLADLAGELQQRDVRGDMFVVGGAAMALAYDTRRATRDVDAVFEPKAIVYEAAAVVGGRRGLPGDWLNDAVKGFLPGEDAAARVVFDHPHLRVLTASPRYLLAMKLLAARVDVDQDDIVKLYELCGFTTAEEGLDLLAATYPGRTMAPRVQFLLEELFPAG